MTKITLIIQRVLKDCRRHIPEFAALGCINLLLVPVEIYALLLSRRLIDKGFLQQNWDVVKTLLAILFVLFIFRSAVSYATQLFSVRLQLFINRQFQDRIFAHLLRLPMQVLTRQPVGRLMSRILDDGTRMSALCDQIFGSVILEPIKFFFLALLLLFFNFRLFVLLLLATAASIGVIHWVGNRMDAISKKIQEKNARIFSYAEEMLVNAELIKAKATERLSAAEFNGLLEQLIVFSLRMNRITLIARPVLQVLKFAAVGAVLLSGSWMISAGSLSIGTLTIFIGTTLLFFNTLHVIGNTYGRLRENLARLEAVYELLDMEPESTDRGVEKPPPVSVQSIAFSDVVFGYQEAVPVLKGVSIEIEKGELVCITGQSGSGKTTLIRLLLRFYNPDKGTIRINGSPLEDLELGRWRAATGIVFQENLILNDTIGRNITYGTVKVADSRLKRAARVSGTHAFVKHLPEGYETVVGEYGRRLSGGQRQRLAIARAIVSEPDVLILDEATSYLEVAQEAEILRRIKESRKDTITILVTHRPSAIQAADRVLTLDNGRIMDSGVVPLYSISKVI